MSSPTYYRGGPSLVPRRSEVRFDKTTGLVKPARGLSVYDRPDHPNLARFGGSYQVANLPPGLQVVQVGEDPSHHEIVPARLMTWDEYVDLVQQITLISV